MRTFRLADLVNDTCQLPEARNVCSSALHEEVCDRSGIVSLILNLMDVIGQFQGSAALPQRTEHLVTIKYEAERAPESGWAL
jgi:hypothetical protein